MVCALRGYRTILSGKMHFCGPDQLHGFEQRLTTDIYPADFNWTPDWDRPEHRPSWYHNMSSVRDAGLCVRSNQLDFDDEAAFMAERAIFDIARSRDQRPFLLVASFSHPHDPFAVPQRYWDLYRDEDIDMPAPGAALDPHSRRLRHVCAMDAEPVTEAQVRAARHAYYGAIAYVDDLLGRLMAALRSAALAEDTIVILHQRSRRDAGRTRPLVQDELPRGRVPRAARHRESRPLRAAPRRGQRLACRSHADARRASGADMQSLGIAVDGRSLAPHLRGAGGHDEAIGEYLAEGAIAPIVMIRRGAYKFIHSPVDPDQLFDLSHDPGERDNLADDSARAALVADFRAEVAKRWDLAELDARVRIASVGAGSSTPRSARARSRPGISSRSRRRREAICAQFDGSRRSRGEWHGAVPPRAWPRRR